MDVSPCPRQRARAERELHPELDRGEEIDTTRVICKPGPGRPGAGKALAASLDRLLAKKKDRSKRKWEVGKNKGWERDTRENCK